MLVIVRRHYDLQRVRLRIRKGEEEERRRSGQADTIAFRCDAKKRCAVVSATTDNRSHRQLPCSIRMNLSKAHRGRETSIEFGAGPDVT